MIEKELAVNYGSGKTIFMEHCTDLFADAVPAEWVIAVLDHCGRYPNNSYVFQTKNPDRYRDYLGMMPARRLLGVTIETADPAVACAVSKAPSPLARASAMAHLVDGGESAFVTVEPILRGDMVELVGMIRRIRPEFVNIGADSKGTGLDEPGAVEVRRLIGLLWGAGVVIREKHNLERLLG